MKRYVVLPKEMPIDTAYEDLDAAIKSAKEWSTDYADSYYVFELVGAVHPGKPRWCPTERKERAEKPKDHPPIFSDDEPLDYKVTVRTCAIGKEADFIGALLRLTDLQQMAAEYIAEHGGAFWMRGLTASQFNNAKSHLESAGATIEYQIS